MLISASPAQADTCTYTNLSGNYEWNSPLNWSCGRVPTAADTAVVSEEVNLTTPATVGYLTLLPGSHVVGDALDPLIVTGIVRWNGGRISARIHADASTSSIALFGNYDKTIASGGALRSLQGTVSVVGSGALTMSGLAGASWSPLAARTCRFALGAVVRSGSCASASCSTLDVTGDATLEEIAVTSSRVTVAAGATLSISGGQVSVLDRIGSTTPGSPAGGRVLTGAPASGATDPQPTTVYLPASPLTMSDVTWEHRAGEIRGPGPGVATSITGPADAMPFVWSGGEIYTPLSITQGAALEILGEASQPPRLAASGTSTGRLTVMSEATIAEGTSLSFAPGTAISVGTTGSVVQYPGSVLESPGGSPTPTIGNAGTWTTFGTVPGTDPAVISGMAISGPGTWSVEDGGLSLVGDQPADLGRLAVVMSAGRPRAVDAPAAAVRVRALSVHTAAGYLPPTGQATPLISAASLNTNGMTTQGMAIGPNLAWSVQSTATTLGLVAGSVANLALTCRTPCPASASPNTTAALTSRATPAPGTTFPNVILKITLSSGTAFQGFTTPPGATCSRVNLVATCLLGSVSAPTDLTVRLRSATRGTAKVTGVLASSRTNGNPAQAKRTVSVSITK
ncbi:MAG: hypothetical protein ACKOT0_06535 [bacterium]